MEAVQDKRYPVYTWHADEIVRFSCKVADMIVRAKHRDDEPINRMLQDLLKRLEGVYQKLISSAGPVARLTWEERDLVKHVAEYMKPSIS